MHKYHLVVSHKLEKYLKKLAKKNPAQLLAIDKKVEEIRIYPDRYKNLNSPLNNLKRVHIDSHFVLLFSVNEKTQTITLEYLEHHDSAYQS